MSKKVWIQPFTSKSLKVIHILIDNEVYTDDFLQKVGELE